MSELTAGWDNFFIATAGAAGALVGLVVVAISVNIKRIIEYSTLPSRAAATVGSLVLLLVIACFSLFPRQGDIAFGVEILAAVTIALVLQYVMVARLVQQVPPRPAFENAYKIALGFGQIAPFIPGGILIATGSAAGMYWIAVGFVAVFVTSMITVWVLLVEIQR
ncbi:MAG TPA: hypothetical protein VGM94_03550 [Galbitalea sp.]|jgi:modulator of FtsH protease